MIYIYFVNYICFFAHGLFVEIVSLSAKHMRTATCVRNTFRYSFVLLRVISVFNTIALVC